MCSYCSYRASVLNFRVQQGGAVESRNIGDVAERPNALVLKTSEGHTSRGSNPLVSAHEGPSPVGEGPSFCSPFEVCVLWAKVWRRARAAEWGSLLRSCPLCGGPQVQILSSPPRARGSTDRASDYGSEGWGFESLRAHQIKPQSTVWAGVCCFPASCAVPKHAPIIG